VRSIGFWFACAAYVTSVASATTLVAPRALADDDETERPPLPESILTESTTDVDAHEAGEVELESNMSSVGEARGGTQATAVDLELEVRVLSFLGARIEPSWQHTTYSDDGHDEGFGISGGLAFGLIHDWAHDAHLQLEMNARHYSIEDPRAVELGETTLPYEPQLLGAWRLAQLTFRGSVGVEFGPGTVAHAPIDLEASMLTGLDRDARLGFFGLEGEVDFARIAPVMLAPDLVANLASFDLPFEVGVAVPWFVGSPTRRANIGVLLRLFYMSEREVAFGTAPVAPPITPLAN
jgi:hypothetical protein